MKKRILIVEDEAHIADGIRVNLELEGFSAEIAPDGPTALQRYRDFDLILLDVMLPGLDGFTVCDRIRQAGSRVPILFLTARDADTDRIEGLEAGGDDFAYQVKAESGAAELARQFVAHAIEGIEDPIEFLGRYAHTVVAHRKQNVPAVAAQ